jgi:hypothetical protein
MSGEKRDFDKEAAAWDKHPARGQLAGDVVAVISRQVSLAICDCSAGSAACSDASCSDLGHEQWLPEIEGT